MIRMYVKGLAAIATVLALSASAAPAATIVDLTTEGATANLTAANDVNFIVQQTVIVNGELEPFVRLRAEGDETSEQGYNTDARPVQFDEKPSPDVTHSLLLNEVPVVSISGTDYRQFVLDINEPKRNPLLSLNQVQIVLGDFGDLGPNDGIALQEVATDDEPPVIAFVNPFSTEVFRLNNHDEDYFEIQLDASLNPKDSRGDMFLYVPDSVFQAVVDANPDRQFVYLYSQFGTPPGAYAAEGKFEEWSVNPVPEPSTVALALTGLGTLGLARLRRYRRP